MSHVSFVVVFDPLPDMEAVTVSAASLRIDLSPNPSPLRRGEQE
jgi:hypothetical protein